MAKKSSDELLGQILNLLDETLGEVKKKKVGGESNAVPLAGAITVDAKSIKAVGDALKILGQAIIPIAKISDKDLNKVTNTIKTISETITSIVMDKDQMQSFYMMATAFEKIAEVIDKISGNFFKSFFKFGPVRAHLVGRRMSRFYKIILKYLVSALQEVMDPASKIKNPKDLKAKLEAMSSLAKLMVFDVKPADLKKIIGMGMVLTEKRGRSIAKFYTALIEELAKVDPDGKTATRAIDLVKHIGKLIAILTISLIAIVALTILTPAKNVAAGLAILAGMVVGMYFLMKALASKDFKKASKGMFYGLLGITALILGLTISLALLTVITNKYKTTVILGALLLLVAIVLVSAGLMWILSRNNIKKSSKESLITVGAIILLFLGMTLSMILAIEVSKKGKEALIGGLLLVAFAVAGAYLIQFLAEIKKPTLKDGLISTAGIILMIAGISAAMLLYAKFLEQMNGITLEAVGLGVALTVAMVGGMIGLAHLMSPLALDPFFWMGFGMVETIALMIGSVSYAMNLFADFVTKVSKLTDDDFNRAFKRIGGNPGMVSCLNKIVDALDNISWKTMRKMRIISNNLKPVFESLSMFVDVIQKMAKMEILDHYDSNGKPVYRKMKNEEFTEAAITATNAFTYFLTTLSTGLEKISNAEYLRTVIDALFPPEVTKRGWFGIKRSSVKKKGIGDIIPCISAFVDVIVKMASMTVPIEWDANGTPIKYRQIKNEEFINAAKTVTDSFVYFIKELANGMNGIQNSSQLQQIMNILFPPPEVVRTGFLGLSKKVIEKPSLAVVVGVISEFMDILIKMKNSLIPDKWDKNGNPIHYREIKNSEWLEAAVTVTNCFTTFLSSLSKSLENDISPRAAFALKLLGNSGIDRITASLGNLMQPLLQLAVGKMQIGDSVVDFDSTKLENGVEPIINSLIRMLYLIKGKFNESGWYDASIGADHSWHMVSNFSRAIAMIFSKEGRVAGGDSEGKDFMKLDDITAEKIASVDSLMTLLYSIKKKFNESGWEDAKTGADHVWYMSSYFSRALAMLFSDNGIVKGGESEGKQYIALNKINENLIKRYLKLQGISLGLAKYLNTNNFNVNKAKQFKEQMEYASEGMNIIKPFLKSTPAQLRDVAKALKEFDIELIDKEQKRTEAIQSISSNFKDMSSSIDMLNKSLSESMNLTQRYNFLKDIHVPKMIKKSANDIVAATEIVKNTVIEANGGTKTEEQKKAKDEAKQKDRLEFANVIASAVSAALTAWAESHKDLTVQFSDSPEKIFGEVYNM